MNPKKKGNAWQAKFAKWMQGHGFRAMSDGSRSGGGIWKGDIHNDLDLTIEVKAVKAISLQEVWRQVSADAMRAANTPVVAIHYDGMPENKYLIVLDCDDWAELMKGNDKRDQTFVDPKAKYAVQRLKDSCREVMKYME